MRRSPWYLVIVTCLALLVACASGPETEPEADEPADPEIGGETGTAPEKPENLLADGERSQLFFDLDQYTGRYMVARDEGNSRAWTSLHATVLMPMVERNLAVLLATAKDPAQPRYRLIAIRALGFGSDLSGDRITPVLIDVLDEPVVKFVNSSLVSLYMLGWSETPIEPIVKLLNHPDTLIRSNAALALSRIVRRQRDKAGDDFEITPTMQEAAGRLMATAGRPEEDPFVRAHSAAALGAIADPGSAEVLINLLGDEHMVVRVRAAQSLGSMEQEGAIRPLIAGLGVTESRAEGRIIAASLEKIAVALDYPVDKAALGLDQDRWKTWYEAVKRIR
ncbi:MAG: HEAT repeat domain-containing protein [Planctomycetota bacterium]